MTPVRGAGDNGLSRRRRVAGLRLDRLRRRFERGRRNGRGDRLDRGRRRGRNRSRLHRSGEAFVGRAPDEAVERSRWRDGRPTVADHPIRHPGLVARGARGAAEPLAHRAVIALGLLDVGHQQADAPGRAAVRRIRGEERGDRRARCGMVVRLQRRASHGQERFGIVGRHAGERPGAGQPVRG